MAHKMHGTWTYFEALKGKPPVEDGKMKLVIPNSGTVDEAQSNHKTKKLKGTARDNTIELFRGEPQEQRDYSGTLVFDGDLLPGNRVMVIAGTWKNNPQPKPPKLAPLDQNEGIWIITKP